MPQAPLFSNLPMQRLPSGCNGTADITLVWCSTPGITQVRRTSSLKGNIPNATSYNRLEQHPWHHTGKKRTITDRDGLTGNDQARAFGCRQHAKLAVPASATTLVIKHEVTQRNA